MCSEALSHRFAASVFRMLLVIRLGEGGGGVGSMALCRQSSCHPDIHCVPPAVGSRARKMSEVSVTKRKEKCENCTKQVSNLPLDLRWRREGHALIILVVIYPFSATRNRVRMVPTHTQRRRKSMGR